MPPSPAGIDAWAKLGNPNWNWKSFRPYLQKSHTVSRTEEQPHLNGNGVKSGSGSIKIHHPTLNDEAAQPLMQAWKDAFKARGYGHNTDILAEEKTVGTRDYSATIDPTSGLRSSADSEYGTIAASRPNVTLITEATVRRILFDLSEDIVATGVEVSYQGQIIKIKAKKEVIMAAGAFNTPRLLELSGIGAKDRLDNLGIPVVLDQPNVGENLQNHLMSILLIPMKTSDELQGIIPGIKAIAFAAIDPDEQQELLAVHSKSENPSEEAILSIIRNPNEASALLVLGVYPGNLALLVAMTSFPFSRGNTHISSSDPDEMPTIDGGIATNTLDLEIMARHVRSLYELTASEHLKPFLEQSTAATDIDTIKSNLRANASTAHHACGTTAMLPRADGGVVGQDLKVYGIQNLRIVDASIFPLISHGNPIATVYGVAERAADLIQQS